MLTVFVRTVIPPHPAVLNILSAARPAATTARTIIRAVIPNPARPEVIQIPVVKPEKFVLRSLTEDAAVIPAKTTLVTI